MHGIPSTIPEESSESSVVVSENETPPEVQPTKSDHYLLSIIADEDTCVGYILGGIGEINHDEDPNFFVVNANTTDKEIEDAYQSFIGRKDMGIILVTKSIAERIHLPHKRSKSFPIVIEIPDKNGPFTIEIDHLLDLANYHDRTKEEKIKNLKERRGSTDSGVSGKDGMDSKMSSNVEHKNIQQDTEF